MINQYNEVLNFTIVDKGVKNRGIIISINTMEKVAGPNAEMIGGQPTPE